MFGKFFKKPEGPNAERTPPGQALTERFPVMTYGATPRIDAKSVEVKVWGLKRSQNYGSKHIDEKPLVVTKATVSEDGKSVKLDLTNLAPTWGMEIKYRLQGADGRPITGVIHNTIHVLEK